MTPSLGDATGSAALAWVGGTALGLLITAGAFYLHIHLLRRRAATRRATLRPVATGSPYRDGAEIPPTDARADALEGRAADLGFQLHAVVFTLAITQLPYVFFWIDVVRNLVGDDVELRINLDLFFMVLLVAFSVILGAVGSAWKERL